MLKTFLTTTSICAIGFAAHAAPPAPAPIFSWTGFYVGGNIGNSFGRSDVGFAGFGPGFTQGLQPNGFIGGVQAGYKMQSSRNFVWGLETDFQWSRQSDSALGIVNFSIPFNGGVGTGTGFGTVGSSLSWLGTTRGIVGFAPDSLPRTLFFATGGVAYGQVKTSFSGSVAGNFLPANCEGPCAFTGRLAFNDAQTKVGWTLGAGIEAALGTNPKWSWKIEYLYVDLGTVGGAVPVSGTVCTNSGGFGCAAFSGTANYSNRMTDNIVRFGVNYRFGP